MTSATSRLMFDLATGYHNLAKETQKSNQHTLLSIINRTSRQNISKDIDLENTTNHFGLTDIYRTLDPTTAEYTFFPIVHRTQTHYSGP